MNSLVLEVVNKAADRRDREGRNVGDGAEAGELQGFAGTVIGEWRAGRLGQRHGE